MRQKNGETSQWIWNIIHQIFTEHLLHAGQTLGWEVGTPLCQPGGLQPATGPLFNDTVICIILS